MTHFPILCENLSVPSSAAHRTLPHCPPDGRGTDPSLLVRSVTSVAHLGVARGASGHVHASHRARDRAHVSCCTSNVPQPQMLLICRLMYFGGELCQSTGDWSKPAIQLEQNRLRGFLHCKVKATASGGRTCKSALVSRVWLDNSFLLWKSCCCFLWLSVSGRRMEKRWPQEWVENLLAMWARYPVYKNRQRLMNIHTYTVIYCLNFWALANCWQAKCVNVCKAIPE